MIQAQAFFAVHLNIFFWPLFVQTINQFQACVCLQTPMYKTLIIRSGGFESSGTSPFLLIHDRNGMWQTYFPKGYIRQQVIDFSEAVPRDVWSDCASIWGCLLFIIIIFTDWSIIDLEPLCQRCQSATKSRSFFWFGTRGPCINRLCTLSKIISRWSFSCDAGSTRMS